MSSRTIHSPAPHELPHDTGQLGMWVFIASEVLFFGGLLLAYHYGRSHWPEGFAVASRHTDVLLGTVNTALLLTSSALVAVALEAGDTPLARWRSTLLGAAAALGTAFLAVKGMEYRQDWQEGLLPGRGFALARQPGSELFFMFYLVMTGLHAVHLGIGIVMLAAFAVGVSRSSRWAGQRHLESGGLYWHFVDIVWVVLYPLLYLAGRAS